MANSPYFTITISGKNFKDKVAALIWSVGNTVSIVVSPFFLRILLRLVGFDTGWSDLAPVYCQAKLKYLR